MERRYTFKLTPDQRRKLEEAFEAAKRTRPNLTTLEAYVYWQFYETAKGFSRFLNRLDLDGRLKQQVPTKAAADGARDPKAPMTEMLTLVPKDFDFEASKAPEPSSDGLTVRFPGKTLEWLERGLAVQNVWNENLGGEDRGLPVFETFDEFAQDTLVNNVVQSLAGTEEKDLKTEVENIYPGLIEPEPAKDATKKKSEVKKSRREQRIADLRARREGRDAA